MIDLASIEVFGTHDAAHLTEVELGHDDSRVPLQHLAEVRRQRVDVGEVDPGDLHARAACALHGGVDGRPRRAPTEHADVGVVDVADRNCGRDVVGDAGDLRGTQVDHPLVVLRRVVDVAATVFLLQTTDAVHQLGCAGNRPRAGQGLGVAQVRPELGRAVVVGVVHLGGERHRDVGQRGDVGQAPRLAAVGDVAVAEQDHRRAVLQRDARRLDCRVEAVRRAVRGDDRQWRLAVAAVDGDVEVGRLGLGRQTGGRAAALHVDEQERQLQRDGQAGGLALQARRRDRWWW